MLASAWFRWTAYPTALIISFLITLWIMELPPPRETVADNLARSIIVDDASLATATTRAGLQASPNMVGFIEILRRVDVSKVSIAGWAVDKSGRGAPITVLVFGNGKNVFTTETKEQRADVTKVLQLSPAAAMSFSGTFSCNPGEVLIVVATSLDLYGLIPASVCP